MSDIEQKREFVMGLYPGPGWKRRVRGMPDTQVVAIYLREVNKPKKEDTSREDPNDQAPF